MKFDKNCVFENEKFLPLAARRSVLGFFGLAMLIPLSACGQGRKEMEKEIILDVVAYSNLDRLITDIFFDNTDLGVMSKYGSTGTIIGVRIPLGVQTLQWKLDGPEGMPRNGEIVTVKNKLMITSEQIPAGTRYLGLHIYPDETAEITFDESIPERTPRGKQIRSNRK